MGRVILGGRLVALPSLRTGTWYHAEIIPAARMSKLLCSRKANLKDYYAILGISPTSSRAEIRRAFRQLALRCHPDVNRDPEATDRFQEITVAYQTLVDPAKRAEYDAARRPGASQPVPAPRTEQQRARRAYFQRRVRTATNPRSTWNYYDVLGISHDANEETIVRSYERLYREFYHGSDVDPGTASILQEIIDARELLTDPAKREAYDRIPSDRHPPGRSQQRSTPTGRGRTEGAGRAEAPAAEAPAKKAGCLPGLFLTPLLALTVLLRRLFIT